MEECRDISRFPGIVSVLRFFVEAGRPTVVDKFGGALSPSVVREALYDALRVLASLKPRRRKLEITLLGRDSRLVLECCEYSELSGPEECGMGVCGRVVSPGELEGKLVECAPCPLEPSRGELEEFFRCIDEPRVFIDLTRGLAAAAFTRPSGARRGEKEKE